MTIKSEEQSYLRVGVRSRDFSVVQAALAEGCDANEKDNQNWTVLHDAVSSGSTSITLALLRSGAKPDAQERYLNSPLHIAAKKGNVNIVQILLDNGASIDLKNIDGNTPEDLATSACKELIQRKRIATLMRGGSSVAQIYQGSTPRKLNPKRSSSPTRQQEHGSRRSTMDSRRSLNSRDKNEPGPGQIQILVEYDRINTWLKVNIQEIKDLKLPTEHNYSHIYVKCYLIPDKNKETKGKTKLMRIESPADDGYSSRGSSASSQSSMASSVTSIDSDSSQIAGKVMSVLKKRTHLHKRSKDKVQCVLQYDDGDTIGHISAAIYEGVWYNALVLRKYNNIMSECKIHLSVCGRNRWTSNGVVIADVIIPVAVALKKAASSQVYQLNYKTGISEGQETKVSMNQSWETNDDGLSFTGRSLAWNNNDLTSESTDAQTVFNSPSVPDVSAKKHRKHPSRVSKLLKGDMKLFKGKQNDRYKKNLEATSQEYIRNTMVENPSQSVVERMGQDKVEYLQRDFPESAGMGQQISEHAYSSSDNVFEITNKAGGPSLKYSRAFGEPANLARNSHYSYSQDVSLEDL